MAYSTLAADNFVTIHDVETIFDSMRNNDRRYVLISLVVSGATGHLAGIGLPPKSFAELSGCEERFLTNGVNQEADILN